MNYLQGFGRMEETKYRNAPAMLPTSQGATQEVSALMCFKSIPNSATESIPDWRLSVPRQLLDRVELDPPSSFSLLPTVGRRFDFDRWDHGYAIAPAIPLIHRHPLHDGLTVDWIVLRCPFCGEHHAHYDVMAIHPSDEGDALIHSIEHLGARYAACTRFQPMAIFRPGVKGSGYSSAKYFIVGIDCIPNTADLNSYFPMSEDFVVYEKAKQAAGYVYLLESNGFYKIGISSNPQKRIQSLQTASPVRIETIHIEQSERYLQLESELHIRFAEYRTQGEWFAFPEGMIAIVIAAMKGGAS